MYVVAGNGASQWKNQPGNPRPKMTRIRPVATESERNMFSRPSNVNAKSSDDDLMVIASTYPVMVGKRSAFGRLSKRVFVRARVQADGKLEFFVDPADMKYLR